MAKKTKKSQQSRSSSSATATATAREPKEASTGQMVLKVKQSEGTRRSARLSSLDAVGKRSFSFRYLDAEEDTPISVRKSKAKQKKKSAKIDLKIPKKPPTAFFYFLEDFKKDCREQNPNLKSMRDIGKACGEKWKTMTYEEKVQYYDIATGKRAEFDKAMAEYTQRKESGEDEEAEVEEEEDWCP